MKQESSKQAEYRISKIFLGNKRKDFLNFIPNVSEMTKISKSAQLIMDQESIELTRNEPYNEEISYYDFIQQSGVQIVTLEELIENTVQNSAIKKLAYTGLRTIEQMDFIFPKSVVADYAKAFILHGPYTQNPDSINICMDLDVMQGGQPNLPQNPKDFLAGYNSGSCPVVEYHTPDERSPYNALELLTEKDLELLNTNPEIHQKWTELTDRLTSGRTHAAFVSEEINQRTEMPQGARLRMAVEAIAARSHSLPIDQTILNFVNYIRTTFQEFVQYQTEVSAQFPNKEDQEKKLKSFLQSNQESFVDMAVLNAYSGWLQSSRFTRLFPKDLAIVGRHDVQSWKDSISSSKKSIYSPNIDSADSLNNPWSRVLGNFQKEAAKDNEKADISQQIKPSEASSKMGAIPNKSMLLTGATALAGSAAALASSEFLIPAATLAVVGAALYYKYGVKKGDKNEDKSR